LRELLSVYFEHTLYDNPQDVECRGYEKKVENGNEYYQKEGDWFFNRCEKLFAEGKIKELHEFINSGNDFGWARAFEGGLDTVPVPKKQKEITSRFLEDMGIG